MFRWIGANLTAMDPEDTRAILDTALSVLRKVPMTIDGTEEFLAPVRAFGCEIRDDRKVFFSDAVVAKTLDRMAAVKRGRSARPDDPPREISWGTSGQALYIADTRDDRLRPCTAEDLRVYCRVQDAIPGLERTHPGFIPQDRPLKTRELHAFGEIALHSARPWRVSMYSPEVLPYHLRILEVIFGSADLARAQAREMLPSKVWVNTPFMITRENIEAPMLFRRLTGQPLQFSAMPVAGMATPVTPAGALALITAEVIACNALALAVDGDLAGWCGSPLFFDMRTGVHTQWGPETQLLMSGARHMAYELLGEPIRLFVTHSVAAPAPSAQSVMERAMHVMFHFMAGQRSFHGLGTLAHSDVISTVQLMLDLEIVNSLRRVAAGFEVNAETLAEDLIAEVAPRGAWFMDTDHTAAHFRAESWFPDLLDRRQPMAWAQAQGPGLIERARAKALRLEAEAPNLCPLGDAVRRDVRAILAEADRALN